jgi:hypothetical protein
MIIAISYLYYIFTPTPKINTLKVYFPSIHDIHLALKGKIVSDVDPKIVIPPKYYDFLVIFDDPRDNLLLPHRIYNYNISLIPNFMQPFTTQYSISYNELLAIGHYFDKNLSKEFI